MTGEEQALIALVRSAFRKEKTDLPRNFDWEALVRLAKQQEVAAIVYEGAVNCGVSRELPAMTELKQIYLRYLMVHTRQTALLKKVTDAFEAAGIDYMLLKGSHLKQLYPKPEMRIMGDADILIRLQDYGEIEPILKKLGFTWLLECDHVIEWTSPSLELELHKRPIPSDNPDFFAYFGDGWSFADKHQGNRWEMRPEDEFDFIFTHMTKHYRGGGIGCRQLLDLWALRRAYPDMDEAYIRRELHKLGLLAFYENICRVLAAWLDEGPWDDKTRFITDFIFANGAFGTSASAAVSVDMQNARKTGSFRKGKMLMIFRVFFPGYEVMSGLYPAVKKHPALRPLFWPVRWCSVLFFHRNKIGKRYRRIRSTTAEDVETFEQALDYVGLKFRF